MRRILAIAAMIAVAACSSDDDDDGRRAKAPAAQAPSQSAQISQVPPPPVILTDPNGMTLYYLDQDTPTSSRCNGQCSRNWPPVRPVPELLDLEKFSVLTRTDGTEQLVFDGHPLYTCISDTKPGDIKCDGHMGAFHAMRY
jgi:predicted lipoprotein with Yx(FWY)xxD motif